MYKTLLVFNNYELLDNIKKLRVWGDSSGFEITDIVNDGNSAYEKMKSTHYDLVITEIRITGIDGLQLLRLAKSENICSHIVLCSEFVEYNYARQGIILGAFDYIVKEFDETMFLPMFNRIKNETFEKEASNLYYTNEIIAFFENRDESVYEYVENVIGNIYDSNTDIILADKKAMEVCQAVCNEIFEKNDWLDLYIDTDSFYSINGLNESNQKSYREHYTKCILDLFDEYCELSPKCNNEKIEQVILYILNNPENNLKQKNIAEQLFINSSYLSTVFPAQTGIRFVDYLTTIKLKRAVWLLRKTTMKIIDIAERLDYKDIGYFSRLFKNKYSLPPSAFRLSDGDDYQI